jgi:hypothetical protein
MTNFPGSPRIIKGAIVAIDLTNPTPNVIVFQYNPGTLSRTLEAQTASGEANRASPVRFTGAPVETISLEVEIDAADQLEKEEANAIQMGIHPQLASLETLIYPRSTDIISSLGLLNAGLVEIIPAMAPFTLFIYGPKRILPVQLTSFNITEEAHDVNLNPIRARVSLSVRVLSYNDLPTDHPGHAMFLSHQVVKETMARLSTINSLDAVLGENISLL